MMKKKSVIKRPESLTRVKTAILGLIKVVVVSFVAGAVIGFMLPFGQTAATLLAMYLMTP